MTFVKKLFCRMRIFRFLLIAASILSSCASSNNKADIVKQVGPECQLVAKLKSSGFSLIPPVAEMVALNMLKDKAHEFNANTVVIEKQSGIFSVEVHADGYRCIKK